MCLDLHIIIMSSGKKPFIEYCSITCFKNTPSETSAISADVSFFVSIDFSIVAKGELERKW